MYEIYSQWIGGVPVHRGQYDGVGDGSKAGDNEHDGGKMEPACAVAAAAARR